MVQIRPSNITMYSISKFPSVMQSEVSTTYLYNHNTGLHPETNKFSPHLQTQFLLPPCYLRLGFTTDFFNRRFRTKKFGYIYNLYNAYFAPSPPLSEHYSYFKEVYIIQLSNRQFKLKYLHSRSSDVLSSFISC